MGWYALYCKSGQEETIIHSCRQHLSGQAAKDIFQFSYERMKKYLGAWHVDTYPLFPCYIFLESAHPALLSEELGRYREIVNVLESGGLLLEVQPEEEHALRELCGNSHHMGMSRGRIEDGRLRVMEGPLTGKEKLIRKIDRHKRVAVLNLQLAKWQRDIWAGLEIAEKS